MNRAKKKSLPGHEATGARLRLRDGDSGLASTPPEGFPLSMTQLSYLLRPNEHLFGSVSLQIDRYGWHLLLIMDDEFVLRM